MGGEEIKTMSIVIFQEVGLWSIVKKEGAVRGGSRAPVDLALFCFYDV